MSEQEVVFGERALTLEDIHAIAIKGVPVKLSKNRHFKETIDAGAKVVESVLSQEGKVYGVTTGFGEDCTHSIPEETTSDLSINLTRFHGCGLGDAFSTQQVRAILAVRLCSLTQGYSGVSWELLEYLCLFLNKNILPVIPQEGSVGASGDLTPLSYVAGALIGERDVYFEGETRSSAEVFSQLRIKPYVLKPKEALALMNGTAVMTGIACLAWQRAEYLTRLSTKITGLCIAGVAGNTFHYDESLFDVKPHKGQQEVASWLRHDLKNTQAEENSSRLQDRYSLRCAPHIVGAVRDALPFLRHTIENELNSANDNPIVDPVSKRVLHGGHFYGGHIAMAMDLLKTQVANLADLHDRQMALLFDPKVNNGLPKNLSAAPKNKIASHHGFKAVHIGCSAWTAEALKLTMPASVFSRSTESHNQDKVSMGTIASRDAIRVLELTEQVAVATMLAAHQACWLRQHKLKEQLVSTDSLKSFNSYISENFEIVVEDRRLDNDLNSWLKRAHAQTIPV
ncbi:MULTISPECIES: histidine ammonia-lyase [Gammaproteobacteria]|uniref:HAL/PAL/TAL family ammonia-lyase n=1 Tax=Gammaproteobacteria TaxID=1236 RepID=UPI000DD0DCE6|nr:MULTISPECIES: aromatic amino acid ammonia-lyase [Gammaproteobacteria]RTE86604.1 aromatic amino acid lyase [Aliidiomarina sp. B3213]TCZ90841.1 aromatic amino acid lyase [Lysobacter sp. N42]